VKTALLVIATGWKYRPYIKPLLESAKQYFVEHEAIVWTDGHPVFGAHTFNKNAEGFPHETLYRYHTFLDQAWLLNTYDQLFYIDVDMRFVAPVGEEIFSSGITATLHPGYVGTRGTTEIRHESRAYCTHNSAYYCGGFNGGDAKAFLSMAKEISSNVDDDRTRGVMAVWHDESHLNRYLADNPPEKVLDPSYCYPENANDYYKNKWRAAGLGEVQPKLLALTKASR
jgi:hypothetical protein